MEQRLWEILVPRYSNDGLEYAVEYHRVWDDRVREIAGGMTIFRTAKGQWVNPEGMAFIEEMIPVRVYCSEDNIEEIIRMTMEYYRQEAVLAYEISRNVKLVIKGSQE
jgi:hypothetical protein